MKFRGFYERALGSRVKIKLLMRLLNEDMSVSERELAGLVGVSHTAVSKAMKEFQDLHLISPIHVGNALLWRTNKESYAYQALFHVFRKEPMARMVELVVERLGQYREVKKAVMFGAAVDGSASGMGMEPGGSGEGAGGRNASVEILIVLDQTAKYEGYFKNAFDRALFELDKECRALFGNGIAAHIASEEEMDGKYKEAVRRGIAVIG